MNELKEVQTLKRVFDNVYKIRTRDFEQDDMMSILRNSQRLECVCHHAYRPVGDPGTRYYLTEKGGPDGKGCTIFFAAGNYNAHRAILEAQSRLPKPEEPIAETPTPAPPSRLASDKAAIRLVAALVTPKGREAGAETISLLNVSGVAIDLHGWQIEDARSRKDTMGGISIAPGMMLTFILQRVKLINTGGVLRLIQPNGEVMEEVGYTASDTPREGWMVKF